MSLSYLIVKKENFNEKDFTEEIDFNKVISQDESAKYYSGCMYGIQYWNSPTKYKPSHNKEEDPYVVVIDVEHSRIQATTPKLYEEWLDRVLFNNMGFENYDALPTKKQMMEDKYVFIEPDNLPNPVILSYFISVWRRAWQTRKLEIVLNLKYDHAGFLLYLSYLIGNRDWLDGDNSMFNGCARFTLDHIAGITKDPINLKDLDPVHDQAGTYQTEVSLLREGGYNKLKKTGLFYKDKQMKHYFPIEVDKEWEILQECLTNGN